MRPVYTVNLYGGPDGRTLYPDRTYYRPIRQYPVIPWRDVGEIILYSILAGLVCVIWLVGVMR